MVDNLVKSMSNAALAGTEDDTWISSSCGNCYSACGIKVHRVNGVVVKIDGDPEFPHNLGRLCAKGTSAIMSMYDPNRVKTPLKRTNPQKGIGVDPQWAEISWDEALDTITDRLRKVRKENPDKLFICTFDTSMTNLAAAFGAAFGSTNLTWMAASYFCGAGLHLGTYLTNASFHMAIDLERCNYTILFGSQLGFGVGLSPNLTTQKMADARVRGMRLVVVDPVCSTAASKADEWVPIRPGTDGALALGMLNVILNELGIYDADFIREHTNGSYLVGPDGFYMRDEESKKPLVWDTKAGAARPYDAVDAADLTIDGIFDVRGVKCRPAFQVLKEHVKLYSPEEVSKITTIPAETIRRISAEYAKAASIGATVVVDGQRLPYRPAAVHMYRGAYSHAHATSHILAIQLLNIVMGNVYVPGGSSGVNPIGPWWRPKPGIDGLIIAADAIQAGPPPYDFVGREPVPPRSASLDTLFPVAWQRETCRQLAARYPEKFGISTPPIEILIHSRGNIMMTTVDPNEVAAVLSKIPLQVSFANFLDETAEFADIVLPDAHFLERLDPMTNSILLSVSPASGQWYWNLRQPVVEPPFQARFWIEALFELADRAGFLEEFNMIVARFAGTRTPMTLKPDKKYSFQEFTDLWYKAETADESKGLDWFREHGHLKFDRTLEERFPILGLKDRIPLYFEHFLSARKNVEQVTAAMHLDDWDTRDFTAVPHFLPCPSYESEAVGFDLYVVNYTLPFHQYSITAENPWIDEVTQQDPYAYKIMVNTRTAQRHGVKDGATICVEAVGGQKVNGQVKVTEGIHPEVIAIASVFGAWARNKPIAKGKGSHFNRLLAFDPKHIDPISASADACARVKIYPA